MKIGVEPEDDERWVGEAPAIPGALAYGEPAAEVEQVFTVSA